MSYQQQDNSDSYNSGNRGGGFDNSNVGPGAFDNSNSGQAGLGSTNIGQPTGMDTSNNFANTDSKFRGRDDFSSGGTGGGNFNPSVDNMRGPGDSTTGDFTSSGRNVYDSEKVASSWDNDTNSNNTNQNQSSTGDYNDNLNATDTKYGSSNYDETGVDNPGFGPTTTNTGRSQSGFGNNQASDNFNSGDIDHQTGFGPTGDSQSQTGGTGSTLGGNTGNDDWEGQQDQQGQGQRGQQGKPSMGDKIKGTMEKLAGTVKKDEALKEKGQATKTGNATY